MPLCNPILRPARSCCAHQETCLACKTDLVTGMRNRVSEGLLVATNDDVKIQGLGAIMLFEDDGAKRGCFRQYRSATSLLFSSLLERNLAIWKGVSRRTRLMALEHPTVIWLQRTQ